MALGAENRRELIPILTGALRAIDLIIIAVAALIAHYLRSKTFTLENHEIQAVAAAVLLAGNIFHLFRLYDPTWLLRNSVQIGRLVPASALVLLSLLGLAFLTKTSAEYSRLWLTYWSIVTFVGLIIARIAVKWQLAHWHRSGKLTRRIAIYGAGKQGQRIVSYLAANRDPGMKVVGIFDERLTRVPKSVRGTKVRGDLNELMKSVRAKEVDEVIVALPWDAEERLLTILRKLKVVPVDVRLCPEGVAFQFPNRPFSDLHGVSVLNIYERPLSSWDLIIKAAEDRILALLILVFILPSMAVIALLIKLDSAGPVFFRQRRYGFNNELIKVYKFRTLFADQTDANADKLVSANDSRVTRIGRFLRRSSLDELPQFINVLKGEMSIVGPRAHALNAKAAGQLYEDVVAEYFSRHRVKPGITGWAQVNGWRGETDTREKIEQRLQFDLYYIEKWSLWFDLRIMLMTPFAMVFPRNNY